jgi:LPS-assembly lipoprotein
MSTVPAFTPLLIPRRRGWVMLALAVLASGCGYQLRGTGGVALDAGSVYVQGRGSVANEVKRQLELSGTATAATATDAEYVVRLSNERYDRNVLSVSPRTGKVEEYEVVLRADYSIARAGGVPLVENEQASAQRDYVFDETAVLGKFEEERQIRDDLAQQVAYQILLRLQTVAAK